MILQPSDFIISLSGNSMISQPGRAKAQTSEGKVQIIYGSKYNPLLLVLFGCKFITTSMMKIQ